MNAENEPNMRLFHVKLPRSLTVNRSSAHLGPGRAVHLGADPFS